MDFHVKLQQLRKQKGYTQEQLAQELHVSRAAISKWESGRGYPNIDSLKEIAEFYGISLDNLLSGEEILQIAKEDHANKTNHVRDVVYGLLDISAVACVFLPFFAQQGKDVISSVSLISLTDISLYLRLAYYGILMVMFLSGILLLSLQNCKFPLWILLKSKASLSLSILGTFLFVVSRQPYAATYLLIFVLIKIIMVIKW